MEYNGILFTIIGICIAALVAVHIHQSRIAYDKRESEAKRIRDEKAAVKERKDAFLNHLRQFKQRIVAIVRDANIEPTKAAYDAGVVDFVALAGSIDEPLRNNPVFIGLRDDLIHIYDPQGPHQTTRYQSDGDKGRQAVIDAIDALIKFLSEN